MKTAWLWPLLALLAACATPRPGYDLPPAGRIEIATASLDPISRYRAILERAKSSGLVIPPAARSELTREGTLRADRFGVDGQRRDTHIYAILRDEWLQRQGA